MRESSQDVTIRPETISANPYNPAMASEDDLRQSGLVNPLDVLVTSPILSEANKIIKEVQGSRRTDTTVNILKAFLDVPLNSELNVIQKLSDVVLWLGDYAEYHEVDALEFFGRNTYQNLTNLHEAGYLRRPTKGMEYDTPALQTTAKGVAYLMWHDEVDDDALLRMLITGTTKDIGYVPADISNTYKTPWQILNDDYFSAVLVNNPTQISKYTQHLIGAESTKFVRNLAAGVFTKNASQVWKTLGPVQVPFLKHFVHRHVKPIKVADSYLSNEIMPDLDNPKELILKLADLIDYEGYSHVDQPSLDKLAKNEVNEEICRIGWLMLQSAGDEITGADWAEEIYLDERPQREQLQSFADNHEDFLEQWKEVVGTPGQWKREALDAMTQGEKAALLERATKAMAFLKTGEAMDLLTDEEMELVYRDMMDEAAAAQAEMLAEDIAMDK